MTKRKLTIDINSPRHAAQEFIEIWHQAEANKTAKTAPLVKLSFANERLLFKTLTPKRCELLQQVREWGKVSIRELAKKLHRDYSNVYQDVKILNHVGLILEDKHEHKYYVPWDTIVTEIPLTVKKTSINKHPSHKQGQAAHR